ncbi:MAG: M3 family peptidase, partial [Actinomycetota bacterium]|nr:M3 family peptidase [Actinomycetota bacterium]
MTEANPFLAPSGLPFELPDFSAITEEHLVPAFEAGMAEQLVEVEEIVASGVPTFDDTVVALERSGRTLDRVTRVFSTRVGAHTSPRIQQIEAE